MKLSLQEIFFFLILIFTSIAFFKIIEPFLADIFLTIVIAILFRKPYLYMEQKFKGRKILASLITIFLVIFILAIPFTVIGIMLTGEITDAYTLIKEGLPSMQLKIDEIYNSLSNYPLLSGKLGNANIAEIQNTINDTLKRLAELLIELIQTTFINASNLLIHFFIILFLLFYVLIDGDSLLKKIQYLIPLTEKDEKELFTKLKQVTDAIVFNTFMIATIEGSYGAFLFAILGVPSPVFWGLIMVILSLIPIVGANTILFPTSLILLATGNILNGMILLIFGVGAIVINQNIIRPRLDGHKSGMHPAIIFLASMGGLIWMGIVGFIAGPLITAVFIVIWNQFGEHYKDKLDQYNNSDHFYRS